VSGLDARLAPGERLLERGVVADGAGFRLAADPATVGVVVPPFAALLAAARCPTLIARGEHDPVVTSAELRAVAPAAIDIRGCGHNLQVESPAAVVALLDGLWSG
jgi:pimeloyl-ACP methyl ester carboxylesterase